MHQTGEADIFVAARSALLDALEALADQRAALVLIGAQAIYLHTGGAPVALASAWADLQGSELAGSVTNEAIVHLEQLFAPGPHALGAMMAGRAEELIGNAPVVSAAVATLAADLLAGLPSQ